LQPDDTAVIAGDRHHRRTRTAAGGAALALRPVAGRRFGLAVLTRVLDAHEQRAAIGRAVDAGDLALLGPGEEALERGRGGRGAGPGGLLRRGSIGAAVGDRAGAAIAGHARERG